MFCEINFENKNLIFDNSIDIIQTYSLSELPNCFAAMEKAIKEGFYLAGFLSYEAGYSFEKKLIQIGTFDFPLLCFGVYRQPSKNLFFVKAGNGAKKNIPYSLLLKEGFNLSRSEYFSKIDKIRSYIKEGETYQITFCVKKNFTYEGSPYALYQKLLRFQPVPYPAYISHKDFHILSLSPEMFFRKANNLIAVKPMKGTLIRDGSLLNALFGKPWLHFDPKNRAENIMITDLLRNDLGKICYPGTIKTTKIFEVAKYRTVYQMTSTVEGKLDPQISIYDIFKSIFPSGSVTGAPKIRAMQIINEIEPENRRIYTGAIGYITPGRELFLNVPIRTILLKRAVKYANNNWVAEMGIGGGITYYSTPEGEYEECEIKSNFLKLA